VGNNHPAPNGADEIVAVPVGTIVKNSGGETIADLSEPGTRWRAARGGDGGRGSARFLANKRRAPSFAELGEVGEEHWWNLELKLLADVALVGFPNVGKSTLISRISAAKPRIADYPFTTLEPNLGVVRSDDWDYIVADIPGLIEGAGHGKGLGFDFLRHIERARVLCVLIDLSPTAGHTPAAQLEILLDELRAYRPELLERPRLLVGSKGDLADEQTRVDFDDLADRAAASGTTGQRDPVPDPVVDAPLVISAVTGHGLDRLVGRLAAMVEAARIENPTVGDVGFVVHRPLVEDVGVEHLDDGTWVITGRSAARAVALVNRSSPDAVAYIQDRLRGLGVNRALVKAGAKEGDTVVIDDFAFDYHEDA
jgi:GTP-binding protein